MKTTFAFVLALMTTTTFAQRTPSPKTTIDDLGVINLHVRESVTPTYLIHGPNYRLGGGNAPQRQILDCLILDIQHSDVVLTLEEKQAVADKLEVTYGLDNRGILKSAVKGDNVVFVMPKNRFYVTGLQVQSKDGGSILETIKELVPPTRDDQHIPAGLIYVRDCRL